MVANAGPDRKVALADSAGRGSFPGDPHRIEWAAFMRARRLYLPAIPG